MKKFYFLFTVLLSSLIINQGFSQGTYTTVRSGNWNAIDYTAPWDVSGKPPITCNNCNITISAGDVVTLDASVELTGNSVMTIQAGAKLVINNSKSTSITSGYNIILNNNTGSPKIVLATPTSTIDASNAGNWDGIFIYGTNFNTGDAASSNPGYYKIVGIGPKTYFDVPNSAGSGQGNGYYKPQGTLSGYTQINSDGTLPIVLANFNAALVNNVVNLTWSTFSELNFSHFVIERSGDQSTWSSIGTVQGQNSPTGANYSYTDNAPLHGNNYYRLKAVDIDNKYAFSDIQHVRTAILTGLRFGPNPAVNQLGVSFGSNISSNVFLRLISLSGQVMQEKQLQNVSGSTVLLPVQDFPSGVYILQVKTDDGSQNSFKFIIAH
jgi:hypothetical protein